MALAACASTICGGKPILSKNSLARLSCSLKTPAYLLNSGFILIALMWFYVFRIPYGWPLLLH
ncbi:MAG TPA: hypothetical protein DCM71_06095 [Runella sp.]|nr:hypothetical protein [Runella sp.]